MSQPRVSLWATEEIDEDLQVDVNLAIGNYGQNGSYDDGAYIPSNFILFFCLANLDPSFALQPNQESMKPPLSPCSIRWRSKQRLRRFLMRSSECVYRPRFTKGMTRRQLVLPLPSLSLSSTSIKPFWRTTSQRLRSHTTAVGTDSRKSSMRKLSGPKRRSSPPSSTTVRFVLIILLPWRRHC